MPQTHRKANAGETSRPIATKLAPETGNTEPSWAATTQENTASTAAPA